MVTGPSFISGQRIITGVIELPEGVEMVMPGDNVNMYIELITPIAMEEGLRFAIREERKNRRCRVLLIL